MANCPKCGYKLKLTDWRPNCPKCDVNLVYYNMEERLQEDADRAESEHAVFQKKIDRLKASFVGSKLTIIRLVLSILPIAALMLPLAKVAIEAPYISKDTTVNAIAIYNAVSSMDFGGMLSLMGSPIMGKAITFYMVGLVLFLLSVVMILVCLVMLMLSCSPKGKSRNIVLNSLMIIFAGAGTVLFSMGLKELMLVFPGIFTGSVSFGAIVYFAMLCLVLLINVVIAIKGVEVKYKQTYINSIPSDRYFEAVEKGEDILALRDYYKQLKKDEEAAADVEKAEDVPAEGGKEE